MVLSSVSLSARGAEGIWCLLRVTSSKLMGRAMGKFHSCLECHELVISDHFSSISCGVRTPQRSSIYLCSFSDPAYRRAPQPAVLPRLGRGVGRLHANKAGTSWAGFAACKTHRAASSGRGFNVPFSWIPLGTAAELCEATLTCLEIEAKYSTEHLEPLVQPKNHWSPKSSYYGSKACKPLIEIVLNLFTEFGG